MHVMFCDTPAEESIASMIVGSSTPHNVPAISTSEDSNEMRSSDCRNSNETPQENDIVQDESRDMGDVSHRLVEQPPAVQDRDDTTPTVKEGTSQGHDATVQVKNEESDALRTNVGGEGLDSLEDASNHAPNSLADPLPLEPLDNPDEPCKVDLNRTPNKGIKAPLPLLPSASTSFDHGMDGQPWNQVFNTRNDMDGQAPGEAPSIKPRHRRSPATTVRCLSGSVVCVYFPIISGLMHCTVSIAKPKGRSFRVRR